MKKKPKFVYFQGENGEWFFHFAAANGEIMFPSEGYTRKVSCLKAIARIKREVGGAVVVEDKR